MQAIEATFDGKVLRPSIPLELKANCRVRVTLEIVPEETKCPYEDALAKFIDCAEGDENLSQNYKEKYSAHLRLSQKFSTDTKEIKLGDLAVDLFGSNAGVELDVPKYSPHKPVGID